MAAVAILNCYFVTVDNSQSLLHGPNTVVKFHVNCVTTVRDMAIWTFGKFGLKRLFPPPKFTFFWGFAPKHYFRHRDPKRNLLGGNCVIWAIKRRDRSRGLIGTASEAYKKGENQSGDKLATGPAHALNPTATIFCMWCGHWTCFPFRWLDTLLIQRLVATAQAVIFIRNYNYAADNISLSLSSVNMYVRHHFQHVFQIRCKYSVTW